MDPFHTIHLETDELGLGDEGGASDAAADPETPAAEAGADAEPSAAAADAAPTWVGPSQDEWRQTQQALAHLSQYAPVLGQLGEVLAADQGGEPEFDFDLLDPQQAREAMRAEAERMFSERFGQYEPILVQQQRAQGHQMMEEAFTALESELGGGFDHGTAAAFAESALRETNDAFQAVRVGAQRAREFEQKIRKEAVEEYRKHLETIASAPREPGVNGAASTPADTPASEIEAAMRWASRP
jgi:hypothetical protein